MKVAPRVVPVVTLAVGTAAVVAWALREHARFLPTEIVPRHALLTGGHHGSGFVPPAPVTADPVVNYPGLVMLALHLTAIGVVAAAWCVRRFARAVDRFAARVSFAVMGSVVSALVTVPVAAMSLGNAILFTGTIAAAMTVLQYTFVLLVAATALFGVP